MTIQQINVGAGENDGTGDKLRVGGQKINANFSELDLRTEAAQVQANSAVSKADTAQARADSAFTNAATAKDAADLAQAGADASIKTSTKNQVNGVAGLDSTGKVAAAQLPSYVDDVLEFATYSAFPATGETGKIYITLTPYTSGGVTSSQFRWTGTAYAPIIASPGSTDAVTEGANNKYFTVARVLDTGLAGLSIATATPIANTDTILSGMGKLQAQVSAVVNGLADSVRGTVLTGLSVASNSAVVAADSVLVAMGKLQAQASAAYNRANVVGTVSQASGVPTGAIVETGTNANGTYTKWADGTMICERVVNLALTANTAWGNIFITPAQGAQSMPATFAGVPKIGMMLEASAGYPVTGWLLANGVTNTTSNAWPGFYIADAASRSISSYNVHYIAKGRWY